MPSDVYTKGHDDLASHEPVAPALPAHQVSLLHRVHADAAALLAVAVRRLLPDAALSVQSFSITTFAAAPVKTHTLPFSAESGPNGLLTCSPVLLTLILDHLLGCEGIATPTSEAMSELTREFLHETLSALLPAYAQAWTRHHPLTFRREVAEEFPGGDTPVFVAAFSVAASHNRGTFSIVLPLPAWAPLLAACAPTPAPPRRELPLDSPLLQAIGNCQLPVRAMLGSTTVSVEELLGLQSGDIICLDQDADAPVDIRIGNQPKLQGRAQVVDGQYYITVTPGVTTGDTHGPE
jgi:flagellar motor switch protein FliM